MKDHPALRPPPGSSPSVEAFVHLTPSPTGQGNHPRELLDLTRAFLRTELESAQFLWHSGTEWLTVRLERRTAATGTPRALLMYREMVLPARVSSREVDILTLLALGLTNGEIAARLGTSMSTVATQIERLLSKLSQGGRGGLAALAVDWGLLRLPIPGGVTGLHGLRIVDIDRVRTNSVGQHASLRPDFSFLDRVPFRLGCIAGSIGSSSSHAREVVRGTALAVNQINAAGGVAGRRIHHDVVRADMNDPDSIRAAFAHLIDRGVDAITTSFATAANPSAFDMVADYGCPYLHTDTYEQNVQRVRSDPSRFGSVFQTCPSDVHYAEGFIDFANQLTAQGKWAPESRRILSIGIEPQTEDGVGVAVSFPGYHQALLECAARSGWDVCETVTASPNTSDWSEAISLIKQTRPDVISVAHCNAEAIAPLQRAIAALRLPTLVFYVYGPSTPGFASSLGASADGVVWSTVTGRYDDGIGQKFHREFTSMFAEEPGWSSSSAAYDQVKLLASAWAAVGTPDFDAVCQFLRSTPQRGVNGVYYFGDPGQSALSYPYGTSDPSLGQAQMVYQFQQGQARALSPSPHGDLSAFRLPSWFPVT